MVAKILELKGYGKIFIQPVKTEEKEWETVTEDGKSVKSKTIGERAKTVYETEDGIQIASNQLCKKFIVDGEEMIVKKFTQTKEVDNDNISVLDENGDIYKAIESKMYAVTTDDSALKDLIINQNKTLMFPFTSGNGFKIWKAMLTNWKGKLAMVCCMGLMEAIDICTCPHSNKTVWKNKLLDMIQK